jgi:hypothetical protein
MQTYVRQCRGVGSAGASALCLPGLYWNAYRGATEPRWVGLLQGLPMRLEGLEHRRSRLCDRDPFSPAQRSGERFIVNYDLTSSSYR